MITHSAQARVIAVNSATGERVDAPSVHKAASLMNISYETLRKAKQRKTAVCQGWSVSFRDAV